MSIAEMLAAEFESAKISKNDAIRKTGIDRSTFYQILGNRRMATPVQLLKILNVLQPDPEERAHLLREYERERVGEEKFAQYEKVRSFLRRLSDPTDGDESAADSSRAAGSRAAACPEQIASLIRHALERSGETRLRLLLPTELFFTLGIEKALEENTRNDSTVYVDQLLSDWDGSSDADQMIMGFADYLTLLERNPAFTVNAYMTDEVLFHPEGTPFPFYIIDDDAMVMFDHTGKKSIQVNDPVQIREFKEHFDTLLQHARPVVELNRNMAEMFAHMSEIMRDSREQIYLLSDTPCIWLSTTPEQDRRYISDEGALAYGELLRSLDVVEFTTQERINRLFERHRITECGVDIEIREEDMPDLRAAVQDRIGRNLFLLNEQAQPLPREYFIFVNARGKMIFAPFEGSGLQVCVENWDFAKELYDWFATRILTVNPEC